MVHPLSNGEDTTGREEVQQRARHLKLLQRLPEQHEFSEIISAPIFTMPVLRHAELLPSPSQSKPFPQYGLLAGVSKLLEDHEMGKVAADNLDPRLFFNVAAPSSVFICGSQGSGKSHTLSCLLENCLINSDAAVLPTPLTGLVLHYDTFISDDGGSPCEAAFLASHPQIKVRVLCSPTNLATIKRTYRRLNVEVSPLQINESDLNTKRILELMAVKNDEPVPLYIHTIYRILREMRITQQQLGTNFNYRDFKMQVIDSGLSPAQLGPLNQRLETLESFMPKTQVGFYSNKEKQKADEAKIDNNWGSKPGWLTIVDLSCPCVTPESACSLFNICLSLFVEQSFDGGRVVVLDEAHKFMNASADAQVLTDTLLSVIRLQRHLGARVIISTQEPTISPILLDLCSVTIAHRFTSPSWMLALKAHLAGVTWQKDLESKKVNGFSDREANQNNADKSSIMFQEIVSLRVGEALLFAPAAIVGLTQGSDGALQTKRLGSDYLKISVRHRLTTDGGRSVMAL